MSSADSLPQVLASRDTGDIRLRLADPPAGKAVLEAAGYTVTSLGDAWPVHAVPEPAAVTRLLAEHGLYLSELSPISADLESVFLELTRDATL